MNWVAIDTIGNVKGFYRSKEEASGVRNAVMLITPDAEKLAAALGNIRENNRFELARYEDTEECVIFLRDSGAPVAERGKVRLTFQDRLVSFQKIHDSVRPEKLTDNGDIMVWRWMEQAAPVWKVHSFTPESAALISGAKIECGDNLKREPVFFVSADRARPLFLNVMEFLFTPGTGNADFDTYSFSLMITPSSTVRLILTFAVKDGGIYNGQEYETAENSPDRELYLTTSRFIDCYYALKQCSNSPVFEKDLDEDRKAKLASKGIRVTGGISRYRVSLSKRYRSMTRNSDPIRDGKEGKTLRMTSVSGFIRNQPCGPGRQDRRLIWVDGFVRGQWVRSGMTYVTVAD